MTQRSPNLTAAKIATIVEVIRGWDGRLTWLSLIKVISEKIHATYTRQALFKHEAIRLAYETYQNRSDDPEGGRPVPASLKASSERVKRLEEENAELRKREVLLMEQFVRWAYNANTRGLTEDFLNQALPPTNRHGNRVTRDRT